MNTTVLTSPKRSGWPYAIAAYFALAITGIAIFITWAVKQNMDLVRSDYYEQEILFQKHLDAAARTKTLGPHAAASYDATSHGLRVLVPAAHLSQSFKGRLHLYRPSDARLDQQIELNPNTDGQQWISTSRLAPGLWKARVEWTAGSEPYIVESSLVIE